VIAVVDYGVNNLASVVRAVRASGHPADLVKSPERLRRAERVVVPGVGHFGTAAATLAGTGLGEAVCEIARAGRPVMGICLGLQLFFETSEEAPQARGLGLLPGRVRRFANGLSVPHVGWAKVDLTDAGRRHPLAAAAFRESSQFYYHVHSYHPTDVPDRAVLATGDYGGRFPTLIGDGSLIGAQFHPEKSQQAGLALLAAFADWQP
jgi:imidazole glycerol-phosphate synthase subunit HisH